MNTIIRIIGLLNNDLHKNGLTNRHLAKKLKTTINYITKMTTLLSSEEVCGVPLVDYYSSRDGRRYFLINTEHIIPVLFKISYIKIGYMYRNVKNPRRDLYKVKMGI